MDSSIYDIVKKEKNRIEKDELTAMISGNGIASLAGSRSILQESICFIY